MDKKILTIVLAVVLIGCFFLAYFGGVSGFDLVKAPGGTWEKYIPILIPLSGILLLIGAASGNYIGGRGLWALLPLLTVIYMIVRPLIDKVPFEALIKLFGVGFWITLVASLVLAFYNPKK
jgi:hypothetical protein